MPNYRRYYISHTPVFVTVVTKNRSPWLTTHVNQLLASMREANNKYPYRHIAHVVIEDHFHWLFEMLDETNFSKLVTFVKRDVIWRLKETGVTKQWQNRFYDHVIRDQHDL
ncbi:MAG: transposase, partial [Gammaproteobacteria bacterium]|nr:transposase [Gammaproteobacteria bacterium]